MGITFAATGQGPYSLASDCTGTATITTQDGTANYFIAVAKDAQLILFMASNAGYTVGGVAEPTFAGGVSNAATLLPGAVAPNEFISLKGTGLGPATGVSSSMTKKLGGASVNIAVNPKPETRKLRGYSPFAAFSLSVPTAWLKLILPEPDGIGQCWEATRATGPAAGKAGDRLSLSPGSSAR
jgi:hypothetical protein